MNKVKIITDSTCDLGVEVTSKYDIEVIPLFVNFSDGTSYLDGLNITTEELYKVIKEKNELPKTAAIPTDTIVGVFKKFVEEGFDIVFSGISKTMSRTFENACIAAKEVAPDRIFVVDSMNLSTGIGLLLLKACKYRDAGDSAAVIAQKLEHDNKLVMSQFAIETMDYLYKGGRCSSLSMIFGSLLRIKPIILVRDGKMHVGKKPIGKMQRALNVLIDQIIADKDRVDPDHIFITHSLGFEYRDYIYSKISPVFPNVDIISTVAGCVISSHCGKNTIGILYVLKDNK